MKVEHVTWLDSSSDDGWHDHDHESGCRHLECNSVGWVTGENDDAITLTNTMNKESGMHRADICIPKAAIIERKMLELREVKRQEICGLNNDKYKTDGT